MRRQFFPVEVGLARRCVVMCCAVAVAIVVLLSCSSSEAVVVTVNYETYPLTADVSGTKDTQFIGTFTYDTTTAAFDSGPGYARYDLIDHTATLSHPTGADVTPINFTSQFIEIRDDYQYYPADNFRDEFWLFTYSDTVVPTSDGILDQFNIGFGTSQPTAPSVLSSTDLFALDNAFIDGIPMKGFSVAFEDALSGSLGGTNGWFNSISASSDAVPEPASVMVWSLLGLSFIGAGCWRRRNSG